MILTQDDLDVSDASVTHVVILFGFVLNGKLYDYQNNVPCQPL